VGLRGRGNKRLCGLIAGYYAGFWGLAGVIPTPTSLCGGPFASQHGVLLTWLCVSRLNYYSIFPFFLFFFIKMTTI